MASSFAFSTSVSSPETTHGKTTFLIKVVTNLAAYAEEDEEAESADASSLTVATSRTLSLRRSYSQFVKLRSLLCSKKLPGVQQLPVLPGKPLFGGSVSDKETEKRCTAFDALFKAIAAKIELATADVVVGFLSEVPTPVYEEVRARALSNMQAIVKLSEGWDVRYQKDGVEIAIKAAPDSAFVMIRSLLHVSLPVASVRGLYVQSENWRLWSPDTSFNTVESITEGDVAPASVLHVHYALPVVNNRDVVVFEASQPGTPDDPVAPDCYTLFATSLEHPMVPKRRGVVRATLMSSVTIFSPAEGGGTRIQSFQQCAYPLEGATLTRCLTRIGPTAQILAAPFRRRW